jgi:hypothetical protein
MTPTDGMAVRLTPEQESALSITKALTLAPLSWLPIPAGKDDQRDECAHS